MFISNDFKEAFKNTFFDKVVEVITRTESIDDEGDVISDGIEVKSTFKGNVNFTNFKSVLNEYGNDKAIDVLITTSLDTEVVLNDLIQYQNIKYKITDVIKCDSHIKLVGVKWQIQ